MCDCIEKMNAALEQHDTRLSGGISMSGKFLLLIATERTDNNKRKRAQTVIASCCPFCGSKFDNGTPTITPIEGG